MAAPRFLARTVLFPSRWPYSPNDFTRMDESRDTQFYGQPRFVNHIDDNAILNLKRYYGSVIPPGAKVLDIASSWVSHLPDDVEYAVTGIGLNQAELDANARLTDGRHVKDLNEDAVLPVAQGTFDAVICNVSIDYLTKPREVCLEAARALKPGGTIHLAISNRCFPTKVISRWLSITEEERLEMVAAYLHFAGSEDGTKQIFRAVEVVEVVKPFWSADPLNVVRAVKC